MVVVRRLFLLLAGALLWASATPLAAQQPTGTITGQVVDSATRAPLPDVTVVVEGTRRGAVTGPNGSFIIVGVPAGSQTVRARRIGFSSPVQIITVPSGGTATLVFALDRRAISLEDVVTTGYGTQRRVAITGSIATINADAANVGVAPTSPI